MYDDMELIMSLHINAIMGTCRMYMKPSFIIGENTVIIHIKHNKYLLSTSNHLMQKSSKFQMFRDMYKFA